MTFKGIDFGEIFGLNTSLGGNYIILFKNNNDLIRFKVSYQEILCRI